VNISKRLTKAELARALGVSRSAVTRAVREGRVTPGPDGLFDLEKARREWRSKTRQRLPRDEGYEYWRQQRLTYQAKIAELDYRTAVGELLDKQDVWYALVGIGTNFRVAIENLAERLAPVITSMTDPEQVRQAVQRELDAILADFESDAAKALDDLAHGNTNPSASPLNDDPRG
jgi:transcriptional regulator with XRE-family HTH domain